LTELNRLGPDLPVTLEHLPGEPEYDAAAKHVRKMAGAKFNSLSKKKLHEKYFRKPILTESSQDSSLSLFVLFDDECNECLSISKDYSFEMYSVALMGEGVD